LVSHQVLASGVDSRNGSISITIVPEPSTWAMTLAGFAGLGWLAHMRRRKFGRRRESTRSETTRGLPRSKPFACLRALSQILA
jgi:hypothetical protein